MFLKTTPMFTQEDLKELQKRGIPESVALEQLNNFEKGFPYIVLAAPATTSSGILKLSGRELNEHVTWFEQNSGKLGILKFVPASGAATRMFKDLFDWRDKLQTGYDSRQLVEDDTKARLFFDQFRVFAFWEDLAALMKEQGEDADELLNSNKYLKLLNALLEDDGLGYAQLPKGLLKFHRYE
jgi:hypothetical protein